MTTINKECNGTKIIKKASNKISRTIEKLIFPPKCGICGKLSEKYLCNKCKIDLQKIYNFQVESYITDSGFCRKNFEEHIYFFQYDGLIRDQIINFKFNEESYKYKMFAEVITKNIIFSNKKAFQIIKSYDIIIPVPISKKRLKERGYNQSQLIAKQIAKATEMQLEEHCLYKNKNIIAQSMLNKEQREENIKGVYSIKHKEKLQNKKVLLFDDIYTTGSTANECCRIIKEAKTKKIGVMTIAKD